MRKVYKRNITLTGGRSYSVVLPKEWVTANNLKQGETVLIEVCEDGSLLMRYEKHLKEERRSDEVVIGVSPLLGRDLIAAYLMGYDRIVIKATEGISSSYRELVKRTVRSLTGAEVISEGHDVIEVQVLLDASLIEPERVLSRGNALVVSNLSMVLEAVRSWDLDEAMNVIMMDEEIDRHYFTFVRAVRSQALGGTIPKRRGLSPIRLLDMRMVAKFIEDVGDRVVKVAEVIRSSTLTADSALNFNRLFYEVARPLVDTQKQAYEAFVGYDATLANSVITSVTEVIQKVSDLQASGEATCRAHQLIASEILRICDNQIDIADIVAPFPKT
ncbi:MAG: phosphate uptake regulator PhoU [Thaumarchaeota archaeon]|nr:phosphate uptake regulator PhoU [Candidatus Calditenuaceae archaeon]MDW8187134.1 phosphate uptake regulator PhoU [Nitrososphaerota archaeon]